MAWLFDGVDDYATLAPHAALALGEGDWTLAGWTRVNSNAGTTYMYFLSGNNWAAVNSCNWCFGEANSTAPNRLQFYIRDTQGRPATALSAGQPAASTAWQHLLLQRSGATVRQFVNGVVDGAVAAEPFGTVDWSQALFFGGRCDLDPNRLFNGAMAEWAKWDRALSTGEMAALVAGAAPGNIPGGLAWHLPMLDYQERVAGLTVTNHGSTLVGHPPGIVSLASHRVAQTGVFVPQAAAELFTTGIAAGQTHEH